MFVLKVNIEIVSSRDSSNTINIRSSTSSPVPVNPAAAPESDHDKPASTTSHSKKPDDGDDPKDFVNKLAFYNEATIKQPVVIRQPDTAKGLKGDDLLRRKQSNDSKNTEKKQHGSNVKMTKSDKDTVGVQRNASNDSMKKESAQITPYASMTDLSVKDLAKLMEHQIQANKDSKY